MYNFHQLLILNSILINEHNGSFAYLCVNMLRYFVIKATMIYFFTLRDSLFSIHLVEELGLDLQVY